MKINTDEKILHLRDLLVTYDEFSYEKIKENFYFAGEEYRTTINFAYLNARLDQIYTKHGIPYDASWMWVKKLNFKNSVKEMDLVVKRLFSMGLDKLKADDIMHDIVSLVYEVIIICDSGAASSVDISLIGIANQVLDNPRVKKLIFDDHFNEDMTAEEIWQKRDELMKELVDCELYGISDILKTGSGVKLDQTFNYFIGRYLRPSVKNVNEIIPRIVPERWIDGLRTRDSHFIETNINRKAAILSKQVIKEAGADLKWTSTISQDANITCHDCGSIHGVNVEIENDNDLKALNYKYQILPDGTLRPISYENDKHLIGTTVKIRSLLTCASREGICATCFGAHHRWSESTELYRRDLGYESAYQLIAPLEQDQLSVKHTTTPIIKPVRFRIVNENTGEIIEDYTQLFDRKFNRLVMKDGVTAYFYSKDCTHVYKDSPRNKMTYAKGNVKYIDTEFNDIDIIRVSTIYMVKNSEVHKITAFAEIDSKNNRDIEFRLRGFPSFNIYTDEGQIPLVNGQIEHVIANVSRTTGFNQMRKLYNAKSIFDRDNVGKDDGDDTIAYESIDHLLQMARKLFVNYHVSTVELLFRNKIKHIDNTRIRPDWTKPDAMNQYVIISKVKAINSLPSLSVKLGLGWFNNRFSDPFFYDPNNLVESSFDLLIDSNEEVMADEEYKEYIPEEEEDDSKYYTGELLNGY